MQHNSLTTKALNLTAFAAFAATLGVSLGAAASPGWTSWVSEENGGPSALCGYATEAARGFDCSGSYCDNVRLYCETLPYNITVESYANSEFFSEEDDGYGSVTSEGWYRYDDSFSHVCYYAGSAGILTGIRCSGSYCDSISVECAIPYTNFEGAKEPVEFTDCYWSDDYSEEDPALLLSYGDFITGVRCSGSYCDSKSYYVCTAQAAADSCGGSCGGQARGGCWCDSACTNYGDCCSDYEDSCVPI